MRLEDDDREGSSNRKDPLTDSDDVATAMLEYENNV